MQTPSPQFLIDAFGSVVGGELSGWVLFTARLSIIRSTISGFSVGNRGELTHGHARAVIGADTGVTYSGEFVCPDKLGSNPGQGSKGINLSGWHGLDMSITVTKRR